MLMNQLTWILKNELVPNIVGGLVKKYNKDNVNAEAIQNFREDVE